MFEDLIEAGATVTHSGEPGGLHLQLLAPPDESVLPPLQDPHAGSLPPLSDPSPTQVLDWVLGGPAGPAAIAMLESLDGVALNPLDEVRLLQAWGRQVSYCEARSLAASLPAAEHPVSGRFGAQEVAAATRSTVTVADRRLALARRLASVLTRTAEALLHGKISLQAARTIHEHTQGLTPQQARQVEAKVLDRAGRVLPASLTAATRKAAAAVDPEGFAKRHREQKTQIDVSVEPLEFGMAGIVGTTTAPDGALIQRALDAWADAHREQMPGTTHGQRKAAALVAWARDSLAGVAPSRVNRPDMIGLLIDLPTLLGLADHPGEVPGFGPVPADVAREFAVGGRLRRMVTDPVTGYLLDYGRTTYRVPRRLADYVRAREPQSSFPTSQLPSQRCDIDHSKAYQDGGTTSATNCGPFDRRGHNAKTHGDWCCQRAPDGTTHWTSPRGLHYENEPHDYRLCESDP